MSTVKSNKVKICANPGCTIQPSYNFKGKPTLYCSKHKLDGMVDLVSKKCIEPGCDKCASFNTYKEGEKKPEYCGIHKKEGMINIKSLRYICKHDGCTSVANFNYENETTRIYCSKHKVVGMIDIVNPYCIHPNCKTHPSYNKEGEKRALYCIKHKTEDMVDLVSIQCYNESCTTQARFNYKGETSGKYCSKHKLDDMVNILDHTCQDTTCRKLASFNYINTRKPLYCALHKKIDMVNVIEPVCKTPYCTTQVKYNKYEGYCIRCFMYMFPDRPVSKRYKTKERSIVEYIKQEFQNYSWIFDKPTDIGCSKKRPDIFLDMGTHIIIIEVDEGQHKRYDTMCENKRMMEISTDYNHRPITFIRFNPDCYTDSCGKQIPSCWGINGEGHCTIKDTKKKDWDNRLLILKYTIQTCIDTPTTKTIDIIHLFYDNYSEISY